MQSCGSQSYSCYWISNDISSIKELCLTKRQAIKFHVMIFNLTDLEKTALNSNQLCLWRTYSVLAATPVSGWCFSLDITNIAAHCSTSFLTLQSDEVRYAFPAPIVWSTLSRSDYSSRLRQKSWNIISNGVWHLLLYIPCLNLTKQLLCLHNKAIFIRSDCHVGYSFD